MAGERSFTSGFLLGYVSALGSMVLVSSLGAAFFQPISPALVVAVAALLLLVAAVCLAKYRVASGVGLLAGLGLWIVAVASHLH